MFWISNAAIHFLSNSKIPQSVIYVKRNDVFYITWLRYIILKIHYNNIQFIAQIRSDSLMGYRSLGMFICSIF